MNVLWLCNIILPSIAQSIERPSVNIGGWLSGLSDSLTRHEDIQLTICFPVESSSDVISGSAGSLNYYGFPVSDNCEKHFIKILRQLKPDVINIFGTEFKHSLDMVNACRSEDLTDRLIIHIQGLVSVCCRHYFTGLPQRVVHSFTLRDILRRDSVWLQAKKFKQRGRYEIQALQGVRHIMGRTDWDKACTEQINPQATYHHCNESLRNAFYEHNWRLDTCQKHSIFLSQCSYPIKGFHFMLEAMPEILKRYPDAHIYTTGTHPLNLSLKDRLKQTYYQKYLGQLIKKYRLQNHVTFLGSLNEEQMCARYLKSHVFVSPSSIENSPNSIGEAMLLGVPTIASDVGGVKSLLTHNEEGFVYPNDEPYMIAHYVCRIFGDDNLAQRISANARKHALQTHDREANARRCLEIYHHVRNIADSRKGMQNA